MISADQNYSRKVLSTIVNSRLLKLIQAKILSSFVCNLTTTFPRKSKAFLGRELLQYLSICGVVHILSGFVEYFVKLHLRMIQTCLVLIFRIQEVHRRSCVVEVLVVEHFSFKASYSKLLISTLKLRHHCLSIGYGKNTT